MAVTLVVAWPSIGEPLMTALPGIRAQIAPAMPFMNARNIVGLADGDFPWGMAGQRRVLPGGLVLVAVAFAHQARTDVPIT